MTSRVLVLLFYDSDGNVLCRAVTMEDTDPDEFAKLVKEDIAENDPALAGKIDMVYVMTDPEEG